MKVYYSVTTVIHSDGSVNAIITSSRSADSKPESSFADVGGRKLYVNWFSSYDEAAEFAEKSKSNKEV